MSCLCFVFAVDKNGDVCISILHEPGEDKYGYEKPEERWLPIHTVETIMISVISMLADPNGDSPANVDAAVSNKYLINNICFTFHCIHVNGMWCCCTFLHFTEINEISYVCIYAFIYFHLFNISERVEGRQTWWIQKKSCPLCKKEPRDCLWVKFI